jgi:hypothetical protein
MFLDEDGVPGDDAKPLPSNTHRSNESVDKFVVSTFSNKRDNRPKLQSITWDGIVERIRNPVVRIEKDGPAFSPARFDPARRAKDNVREIWMLVLDYDVGGSWRVDLKPWRDLGIRFAAHTTHSHQRMTSDHTEPADRFRVIIPLLEPISAAEFDKLFEWAYRRSGGKLDRAARDPSRMFY